MKSEGVGWKGQESAGHLSERGFSCLPKDIRRLPASASASGTRPPRLLRVLDWLAWNFKGYFISPASLVCPFNLPLSVNLLPFR